jgi:hypothetical protein
MDGLFREGGSDAWVIIPPVALGTAVCAGVLLFAYRHVGHARSASGDPAPELRFDTGGDHFILKRQ